MSSARTSHGNPWDLGKIFAFGSQPISSMFLQEAESSQRSCLVLSSTIKMEKKKIEIWYHECHPIATAPRDPSWHQDMAVAAGKGLRSQ